MIDISRLTDVPEQAFDCMLIRFAIGIGVVAAVVVAAFCTWGDQFLRIEPGLPSERVDAAVVLAGPPDEDRERVLVAADLVQEDEAGTLLLPLRHRALDWPWFVRKYRVRPYLPEDRVLIGREDGGARNASRSALGGTFAEAKKTIEIMQQNGLRTAVIVSSGYHMRRARLAFQRANRNPDLVFYFHPVDSLDPDEETPWWLNGGYALRVADEYVKLVAGYLFYR
jgi:hypothetical protein